MGKVFAPPLSIEGFYRNPDPSTFSSSIKTLCFLTCQNSSSNIVTTFIISED